MTGTTLVSRVRSKLDDTSYSSDKILEAGSDFMADICTKHKFMFMETSSTISVADEDTTATLPANLLTILSLRLTSPNQRDLTRDFVEYNRFIDIYPNWDTTDAMTIFKWTMFGNQIRFAAPADGVHTLKVDYIKKPTRVTELTSSYELPDSYDELLVLGALYRVQQDNEDYQEADQRKFELEQMIRALVVLEGRGGRVQGQRSTIWRKRGGLNPQREW